MLRQVEGKQWTGHVLEISPHEVSMSMVKGEAALHSLGCRAHMPDDCRRNVIGPIARQTQTKSKIDILEVTEKILVESSQLLEYIAPVQDSRGGSGKNLSGCMGKQSLRLSVIAPPCESADVIEVTGPVHQSRV